jgi:hypothetical protein
MRCSAGKMRVEARQWADVVTDPRYQVRRLRLSALIMLITFSALNREEKNRRRNQKKNKKHEKGYLLIFPKQSLKKFKYKNESLIFIEENKFYFSELFLSHI